MSTYSTLQEITKGLTLVSEGTATSLPQYARKTLVLSRAYIDQALINDPILDDVMNYSYLAYTSYILNATSLYFLINSVDNVRKTLNVIATENLDVIETSAVEVFKEAMGLESISGEVVSPTPEEEEESEEEKDGVEAVSSIVGQAEMLPRTIPSLASGRVVPITLQGVTKNDGKPSTVTIPVYVQIMPLQINSSVMQQFVRLNTKTDFRKRFIQWRTGEIRFWQDLIAQNDIMSKYRESLRKDKGGELRQMLERQDVGRFNLFKKVLFPERANISTTIMVYEQANFDKACADANVNMTRTADRSAFMRKTFSLFVIVVDTMSNRVKIYVNGLDHIGEYTYSQLKNISGAGSKSDLEKFLDAISKSQLPRL